MKVTSQGNILILLSYEPTSVKQFMILFVILSLMTAWETIYIWQLQNDFFMMMIQSAVLIIKFLEKKI